MNHLLHSIQPLRRGMLGNCDKVKLSCAVRTFAGIYKRPILPILFRFDAEKAHYFAATVLPSSASFATVVTGTCRRGYLRSSRDDKNFNHY